MTAACAKNEDIKSDLRAEPNEAARSGVERRNREVCVVHRKGVD